MIIDTIEFGPRYVPDHLVINKSIGPNWQGLGNGNGRKNREELAEIREMEQAGVIPVDVFTADAVKREQYFKAKARKK